MNDLVIAAYVAVGILLPWILCRIFAKPIRLILKLLLNSVLGLISLFIFNYLGSFIGVELNVGWISALVCGTLGIPGMILLILIENLFL